MAGRPSKPIKKEALKVETTTIKTPESSPAIDIDAIINKVKEQLESEYANKIKQLEAQIASTVKSQDIERPKLAKTPIIKKREYKYIPADTRIIIKSNVTGLFTYIEDRGKTRLFIEIADHGGTYELTYEEFSVLYTSKPHYFKSGMLAIIDVIADKASDITIEDIIENKQLQSVYFDEKLVDPRDVEAIFDEDVDPEEFNRLIRASGHMSETILEIAHSLYKRRQTFHNNAKMNYMKTFYKKPNLFK